MIKHMQSRLAILFSESINFFQELPRSPVGAFAAPPSRDDAWVYLESWALKVCDTEIKSI